MRVVIYDDTDRKYFGLLRLSWIIGATLGRLFGVFTLAYPAKDWTETLQWMIDYSEAHQKKWSEVQFWCHGSWGAVILGKSRLTALTARREYKNKLQELQEHMEVSGYWWFRTCGSFASTLGHSFAKTLVQTLDRDVWAHTYLVHLWQSGLVRHTPERTTCWWPVEMGVKEGTPERPTKMKLSTPFSTRTLLALRLRIPPRFWRPGA